MQLQIAIQLKKWAVPCSSSCNYYYEYHRSIYVLLLYRNLDCIGIFSLARSCSKWLAVVGSSWHSHHYFLIDVRRQNSQNFQNTICCGFFKLLSLFSREINGIVQADRHQKHCSTVPGMVLLSFIFIILEIYCIYGIRTTQKIENMKLKLKTHFL